MMNVNPISGSYCNGCTPHAGLTSIKNAYLSLLLEIWPEHKDKLLEFEKLSCSQTSKESRLKLFNDCLNFVREHMGRRMSPQDFLVCLRHVCRFVEELNFNEKKGLLTLLLRYYSLLETEPAAEINHNVSEFCTQIFEDLGWNISPDAQDKWEEALLDALVDFLNESSRFYDKWPALRLTYHIIKFMPFVRGSQAASPDFKQTVLKLFIGMLKDASPRYWDRLYYNFTYIYEIDRAWLPQASLVCKALWDEIVMKRGKAAEYQEIYGRVVELGHLLSSNQCPHYVVSLLCLSLLQHVKQNTIAPDDFVKPFLWRLVCHALVSQEALEEKTESEVRYDQLRECIRWGVPSFHGALAIAQEAMRHQNSPFVIFCLEHLLSCVANRPLMPTSAEFLTVLNCLAGGSQSAKSPKVLIQLKKLIPEFIQRGFYLHPTEFDLHPRLNKANTLDSSGDSALVAHYSGRLQEMIQRVINGYDLESNPILTSFHDCWIDALMRLNKENISQKSKGDLRILITYFLNQRYVVHPSTIRLSLLVQVMEFFMKKGSLSAEDTTFLFQFLQKRFYIDDAFLNQKFDPTLTPHWSNGDACANHYMSEVSILMEGLAEFAKCDYEILKEKLVFSWAEAIKNRILTLHHFNSSQMVQYECKEDLLYCLKQCCCQYRALPNHTQKSQQEMSNVLEQLVHFRYTNIPAETVVIKKNGTYYLRMLNLKEVPFY